MKVRMYIDEVGNRGLADLRNPNNRYLSLTGVIIELDHVQHVVYPEMEAIKRRFFQSHPDDPVIFHRKELVNKRPPFAALRDEDVEQRFNLSLLELLSRWDFTVITTVIDKLKLVEQYAAWRYDPYHYCLKILVERFVRWLERNHLRGDVLAESRGGKEDRRLMDSFRRL